MAERRLTTTVVQRGLHYGGFGSGRVLHAGGDATGEYIEVTLSNQVISSKITVLENFLATKILMEKGKVSGIQTLDCRTGTIEEFETTVAREWGTFLALER